MEIRVGWTFSKDILLCDNFFRFEFSSNKTRAFLKGSPELRKIQISDFFTGTHRLSGSRLQDGVQDKVHFERDSRRILVLASELQRNAGPADFLRDLQGLYRSSVLSVPEDYHGDRGPFQVTPFDTGCTSVRGAI